MTTADHRWLQALVRRWSRTDRLPPGRRPVPRAGGRRGTPRRRLSCRLPRGSLARRRHVPVPAGLAERQARRPVRILAGRARRRRAARARRRVPRVFRRRRRDPSLPRGVQRPSPDAQGRDPLARRSWRSIHGLVTADRGDAQLSPRVPRRLLRRRGAQRRLAAHLAERDGGSRAGPVVRGIPGLRLHARAAHLDRRARFAWRGRFTDRMRFFAVCRPTIARKVQALFGRELCSIPIRSWRWSRDPRSTWWTSRRRRARSSPPAWPRTTAMRARLTSISASAPGSTSSAASW